MRPIARTFALTVWCCGGALVAAGAQRDITSGPVAAAAAAAATGVAQDEAWPCFLLREGPQFTAALERDIASSRQRLLAMVGGDAESEDKLCPAAARALADFRRDLTTLFDATISKERVLDRLRTQWTRRWQAAQCEEVSALAKSANADTLLSAADPRASAAAEALSLTELMAKWLLSTEGDVTLRDKPLAQRITATLLDIKSELAAVQHDANAALKRALPPLVKRDRQAALTAVDSCIATEEARLAREPGAAPPPPASSAAPPSAPATDPAADPAAGSGLSVDPPAPFVVTRGQFVVTPEQTGPIVMLRITSSTGKPAPADGDGTLCDVVFRENPENAGVSQEEINQRVSGPQWHNDALASLRTSLDVDPGQPVERLGIRGMEFVATLRLPASARKVRIYMVMLETPKGHTTMTCATPAEGFADALPQFRAIRDTIRPPR
jgi:hypothetical protein